MEFNPLYLKYLFLAQCFCVSLGLIEGGAKFTRKNQPVTFECPFEKQNFEHWKIDGTVINRIYHTSSIKANVFPNNVSIINITLLQNIEQTIVCENTTGEKTRFYARPLFNDNGNLYPSFEIPNAIKDKNFTLKCNVGVGSKVWYTGNGTVIAKYSRTVNQKFPKYFGSRQETSCQEKICTLSITNVSLAEDNMSIICSSGLHTSMFNITVFVLPKSVTVKSISNTVPVENQNKSYECLIKDTNPEFSVFWLITKNDGTQKNVTKYISNKSSKSGKLSTLSSELTLTLNKNFKELQCVAYFPGKSEFDNHSKELDLDIKYSPERDDLTLNVSRGKVCVDTPIKFRCIWKGGDPPASVTLKYEKYSNTSKEEVEINVKPSKFHQTVKCLGIHIAANVSREKNLTIYYPPDMVEIKADEPFLEGDKGILHCKAINGYPEKYSYRWDPSKKTSQNLTFPQLNRTHNNEDYTCYVSNKCSKRELHKTHWINVEYPPDITAPDNVTLFENQASIIDCNAKGNPTPEVWLENENRKFLSNSILTFNRKNISRVFCSAIAKSEKNGNFRDRKEINILLKYPPQVNIHISNETNKIIISCTASGGNPANHKYELKQKWGNTIKNTYDIKVLSINPSFSNTGTWECHVSNDDFLVIKSSNYKIPVRPMFSSGSNGPKQRNVSNGETVILKQCFYSHPKSDVKWQKNEESIDSNKYLITDYFPNEFPFKGSCTSLKIEDTKYDVIDTYTLTVENSEGKETVVFTLRYKKKQEIPMEIIIGCTVGIVLLLIIMGLLTYIFYKRGGFKCNKETSSAKGAENDYANFPDGALNAARAYAISSKPNTNEEQYAEASGPSYLELKPADMKISYVNVSRKPDVVEGQCTEVSEPKYSEMGQRNTDGTYVNVSKKPAGTDGTYVNVSKKPVGYQ